MLTALFFSPASASDDLNSRYELEIETNIRVPVSFINEGPGSSLESLIINYSWIPDNDYRQQLYGYESHPKGVLSGEDVLRFNIREPRAFILDVNFSTYSNSAIVQVEKKVSFPLKGLGPGLSEYTEPTEKIDINEDIRKKASELASGEDDLYAVVFNIADWINTNVEYNLSTATADASLPSSWVYENRYGVCDEISNLFISMCRSLGIPARFVSGIAYTDDTRFENPWGPHGWAEVYFPQYGWIPFDPTYDQLGYVDATHIKFDDKEDSNKNAVEYTWIGRNIGVSSGRILIDADVTKTGAVSGDDFKVNVGFMMDEVGIGSYNVVIAEVENLNDYYVAAPLAISRTQDLTTVGNERRNILLKPHEKKTVYWIIQVAELDDGYIYTFPVTAYSNPEEATGKFKVLEEGERINLRTAENFISSSTIPKGDIGLDCSASKNIVYIEEKFNITCSVNESGPWKLCIENACSLESLNSVTKNIDINQTGFSTLGISASKKGEESFKFLSFKVLDAPNVTIEITKPQQITFSEKSEIEILLRKESDNAPHDAVLSVSTELMHQSWKVDKISDDRRYVLEFYGKQLQANENKITVVLTYYDEAGEVFTQTEETEIVLHSLTIYEKVYVWINAFFLKLESDRN